MARSKRRSSDESDEDYLVGQDEEFEESEDECNLSVDEEDLDEIVGGFEEEFVKKKTKKVGRSTVKAGLRGWGKVTRKNRSAKPKKKRNASYKDVEEEEEEEEKEEVEVEEEEEDEDGCDEDYDFEDEKMKEVVRLRKQKITAHRDVEKEEEEEEEEEEEDEEEDDDEDYDCDITPRKRKRKRKRTAHRVVEEEDEDDDEDDDDDDEDCDFVDEKSKKVINKKRTAHRDVEEEDEEEEDDDDEDYVLNDEKIKQVIRPNKDKITAHREEKRRVWHREEGGGGNVSDNRFDKPRGSKRVSYTEDKEDFTIASEEEFDMNKLKIVRKPRRKRKVACREVNNDFNISQEEDFDSKRGVVDEKPNTEKLTSYGEEDDDFGITKDIPEVQRNNKASKSIKEKEASYREDDDDYDGMDDDDEDEEFTPDEINGIDVGDELSLMKEMDLGKPVLRELEVSCREEDDAYGGMDDNDEDEEFRPDEYNDLDDEELPLAEKENELDNALLQENVVTNKEDDEEYDAMDDNDEVEELMPDEIDDEDELPLMKEGKEASYREDDDDYDGINDDDEEFTPDEIDDLDDEEELPLMKQKKKVGNPLLISRRRKRKRNLMGSNYGLRRCTNDEKLIRKNSSVEERNKKVHKRGKRRRLTVNSDSDLVSSGSSDYEFTISEEEREQIREANEFCRNLVTSTRSSTLTEMLEENKEVVPQRKRMTRKGKEKVEDVEVEVEVGKQVCGICLSEEAKRSIRGTLNCCSHYFCFACIMEWSKVESRCPLCKQRFATISKPAKCNTGFDLRTVVIQIPERDQVYQPSEEEIEGFLDPYDNVICTECHQGGDDAVMLLCDLCDSPAHTYCVGLGREVPEGNWYCEGCRPTALGSPNPEVFLTPTADHRSCIGSSPATNTNTNIRETFDLNEMYVPDTPLSHDSSSQVPSPRPPVVDAQLPSPASGSGAHTVLGRRRIQRQIHNILNSRWRHRDSQTPRQTPSSVSGHDFFGFATPQRLPEINMGLSLSLRDGTMPLIQHRDVLASRFSHMREELPRQNYPSTSTNPSLGTFVPNEFSLFNSRVGFQVPQQQLQPCSIAPNANPGLSSYPYREMNPPFLVEKPQIQSMVRSQLITLSKDLQLAHSTFKDIARSSTHTILAICGAEHRQRDVHPVQTSLICHHNGGSGNVVTGQPKGPCSSCFDLFVKSVICEIMSIRVPFSSKNN